MAGDGPEPAGTPRRQWQYVWLFGALALVVGAAIRASTGFPNDRGTTRYIVTFETSAFQPVHADAAAACFAGNRVERLERLGLPPLLIGTAPGGRWRSSLPQVEDCLRRVPTAAVRRD